MLAFLAFSFLFSLPRESLRWSDMKEGYVRAILGPHKVLYRKPVRVGLPYLEPDLFIDSDWPVGEGNGITEAGKSAHAALRLVHHDLRAFRVGMETERQGGWQRWAHAHLQGVVAKGSSI